MARILQVLGGLALFLYGIRTLSAGMEKIASTQLQQWLDRMVNHPIKAALFGTAATAMLQSSGLLMVTMIGLINANLMTLEQAISVMMGQEIGTTITAQIVSFRIGNLTYIFLTAGLILTEFVSNRKWQEYGQVVIGFGMVSLGMQQMTGALAEIARNPQVTAWLTLMGQNSFAGVFGGMAVTALIQSSTAVTALIVAMGMSNSISLRSAIALILGANIGSCVTGLIASVNLSRNPRRASMAQILINVMGVLLFFPFVAPYASFIARTSSDLPRQIANAHTIFNITVSVVMFPFVRQIAALTDRLLPKAVQTEAPPLTQYIDARLYRLPAVAVTESARELQRIADTTAEMLHLSCAAIVQQDLAAADRVLALETDFVDPLCRTLEDFINTLMQGDLSVEQQKRCFQLKHLIIDIERVGDLTENMAENAHVRVKDSVPFSEDGIAELLDMFVHAQETYRLALETVQTGDRALAQQTCESEEEFDHKYLEARQRHLKRLELGVCVAEADFIFSDTLRDLERVCDHADNLAIAVLYK